MYSCSTVSCACANMEREYPEEIQLCVVAKAHDTCYEKRSPQHYAKQVDLHTLLTTYNVSELETDQVAWKPTKDACNHREVAAKGVTTLRYGRVLRQDLAFAA